VWDEQHVLVPGQADQHQQDGGHRDAEGNALDWKFINKIF
jgi:hypothetical protein